MANPTSGSSPNNTTPTFPFTWGAGDSVDMEFSVPLVGRSANVQMADSATFKISSYLANGTRVIGTAPARLGEYRSFVRTGSTSTFSDAAPGTLPSASNGMRIWSGLGYASTDTNVTRYQVFVGKNKHVKIDMFSAAGRTGFLDYGYYVATTTVDIGLVSHYDPTTGIVEIGFPVRSSATSAGAVGLSSVTGSSPNNGYFDVTVSENALAVGMDTVRSEIWLQEGNGWGSTATKIRRFLNVLKNTGSAFNLTQSATNGDSITILQDGIYAVSTQDYSGGTSYQHGVSIDSAQLTTNVINITPQSRPAIGMATAANASTATSELFLPAGSVVRHHGDGGATSTSSLAQLRITKVSN
jgi:hypothetical protein